MKFKPLFLIVIFHAARPLPAGSNSLLSLEEPLSARSPAMGGAFVALADDSSATSSNPAGLGQLKAADFSALYKKELLDLNYTALSAVYPMKGGSLGLALTNFDGGNLEVKELDGSGAEMRAQQDIALDIAYGAALKEQILIGAGIKYVRSSLAGVEGQALALDFGVLLWVPFPRPEDQRLSLGLSLLNVGPGIDYGSGLNPIAQLVKFGAAYHFVLSERETLQILAEGSMEKNRETSYSVGAEYLHGFFAFRAGFGEGNPSLGAGLKLGSQQLDYCFSPLLDQALHVVSYTWHFRS